MRVTIGSAAAPQSWTMRAKSPPWKRARPRANAASASTAPPMNLSISTTPPEAAMTAVPIRPSHGKGAASSPVSALGHGRGEGEQAARALGQARQIDLGAGGRRVLDHLGGEGQEASVPGGDVGGVEGEASGRGSRGHLRLDLCGVRELIEHLPAPGKLQHERAVGGPTHGEGPRAHGRSRGGGAPPPHARTVRTR